MGSVRISTTISEELHKRAQKLGIPWARALEVGVIRLSNEPFEQAEGITLDPKPDIQEEKINKLTNVKCVLEEELQKANDEIDKIRNNY